MSESLSSEYSGVFTKQEMDEYKIAFDEFDANKNEILGIYFYIYYLHILLILLYLFYYRNA